MEKLKKQQVYKDPLYGYIHVDDLVIKDLINSAPFQRLRRIRHLSGVQMVFHGAEHSRFSHSLGVYEIANRFMAVPDLAEGFDTRQRLLFLVSALLHDIGHGAYSHAFEDVFGMKHEVMGAALITGNKDIRTLLDRIDQGFAEDVASILLKEGRFALIEQLISSQLDVDRLDYLERDAYFTGAAYGRIDLDRLIRVLHVRDGQVVFKHTGIHAIENYLIARYHMYWQVYYHPVAHAYEVNLEKICLRAKDLINQAFDFGKIDIDPLKRMMEEPRDIDNFIQLDDYYVNGLLVGFAKANDRILRLLAGDFLNRRIWGHMSDTKDNKAAIEAIKKGYDKEEQAYFTACRTVENSTYQNEETYFGDKIYIMLDNGSLSSLRDQSKIMESLTHAGTKSDTRFFYRKP
ncbi:MAG: HD domain-containing protein [Acholeplasmataceae bacterium]|nr:MAG: HD domain-containing protein [Acholeplasmataceae bacterium]